MPQLATTTIATLAGAPLLLAAGAGSWTTHTVREGDTLWDLAAKHRTDVRTLARANQLRDGGQMIHVGSTIKVPGSAQPAKRSVPARPSTARYVVRSGDTVSAIALRLKVPAATILRLNHLNARTIIYPGQHLAVPGAALRTATKARTAAAANTTYASYTVRSGDTVSAIATRAGSTQAAVLKANNLNASSLIRPGQKLRVPRKPGASTAKGPHNTFAGRTYADSVVRAAAANRHRLASRAVPGKAATRRIIERTARSYGVDPALAVAVAYQESGWNQRQVSVANAIGTMQVIPSSGDWASALVGRRLNLLDTNDNITAGVVILRALTSTASSREQAIAGYYQGLASVRSRGMYADTKVYVKNIVRLTRSFR